MTARPRPLFKGELDTSTRPLPPIIVTRRRVPVLLDPFHRRRTEAWISLARLPFLDDPRPDVRRRWARWARGIAIAEALA